MEASTIPMEVRTLTSLEVVKTMEVWEASMEVNILSDMMWWTHLTRRPYNSVRSFSQFSGLQFPMGSCSFAQVKCRVNAQLGVVFCLQFCSLNIELFRPLQRLNFTVGCRPLSKPGRGPSGENHRILCDETLLTTTRSLKVQKQCVQTAAAISIFR